tara:strand:- start:300 stop:719 length:420 start_codon:yes stop_codon:yes gene_type:complete
MHVCAGCPQHIDFGATQLAAVAAAAAVVADETDLYENCVNTDKWEDSYGYTCEDYASGGSFTEEVRNFLSLPPEVLRILCSLSLISLSCCYYLSCSPKHTYSLMQPHFAHQHDTTHTHTHTTNYTRWQRTGRGALTVLS